MNAKWIRAAFAALLVTGSAFAQMQAPPAPAQPKNFTVPAVRKFTMPNGLQVRLVPYGSTPKLTIRVSTFAGRVNETENQTWLSELTAKMMQEGTTSRSAQQVALEAANMGGAINVTSGPNLTQVQADALSEFGPAMVKLVADVARNPKLPETELARLKTDLARDLSIARSQPQQIAGERFARALYPNQAYGRMFPTDAMLGAFTANDVRAFHEANFTAARSIVYVVGMMDAAAVEQAIRSSFGDWKSGTAAAKPAVNPSRNRATYLIDRPGAVQSTIYIGLPVALPSAQDWVAQQVANTMLGGYFSSRITSNIREAKGYTYSPFSTLQSMQQATAWFELADVTTNVTGPALKEILFEIDRLQNEAPSADELRGVQNYMAGNFILQSSSRGGIINQLQFVDLHGLPDDYLQRYVERVYAVTPADVQRIAQTQLDESKMTIVIAGDRKQIATQLEPFGKFVD